MQPLLVDFEMGRLWAVRRCGCGKLTRPVKAFLMAIPAAFLIWLCCCSLANSIASVCI